MAEISSHRPTEWRRLFSLALDLIDQLRANAGGYPFDWSFGGGTAMMIQIGHRESHDVDIFLDDPQLLGFIDPAKSTLRFETLPDGYQGDGARFQKFAFEGLGEIDFIVAGPLTDTPFVAHEINGLTIRLETVPEIIAKKIYYRGGEAKPRDIFDLAAAASTQRTTVVDALRAFPGRVGITKDRLDALNPEFVARTIAQLMIKPGYVEVAGESLAIAKDVLEEILQPP